MKLTSKSRWKYNKIPSLKQINESWNINEWIRIANSLLPSTKQDYIELGCAPGTFTAALTRNKPWLISGIDYSVDSELFLDTLKLVGKQACLHKGDLLETPIINQYDIVASYGLVEHFRGHSFGQIMSIHDNYLRNGGYVVISVPNFTGFPYLFHFLFDLPDLDRHNIDAMHPDSISGWLLDKKYNIIYKEYVGVMRLWGNSSWVHSRLLGKSVAGLAVLLSKMAILLGFIGISLRGRAWSPYLLVIAQKTQ